MQAVTVADRHSISPDFHFAGLVKSPYQKIHYRLPLPNLADAKNLLRLS